MTNPMKYDVNLGNVARWRQQRSQVDLSRYPNLVARFGAQGTADLVESIAQREGEITTKVTGNQVDVSVRLYKAGRAIWYTTVGIAATGFLFVVVRVVMAIASGRVTEILTNIVQASH